MIRVAVLWMVLLAVLGYFNWGVWQKEQIRQSGTIVLIELAPVDPRSLMQGDYMRLRLDYGDSLEVGSLPHTGQLIFTLDENGVGTATKLVPPLKAELTENQVVINYITKNWGQISIGADTFFFQEGMADHFAQAEYAELRVGDNGQAVLTGLRDENLQPL